RRRGRPRPRHGQLARRPGPDGRHGRRARPAHRGRPAPVPRGGRRAARPHRQRGDARRRGRPGADRAHRLRPLRPRRRAARTPPGGPAGRATRPGEPAGRHTRMSTVTAPPWPRLTRATAHLPAPLAVLDRAALEHNADDLVRRAGGKPIRVATKSVRSRPVLREVLRRPGYAGLLAYALPEALWLAQEHEDVVVAYPTVDRVALAELVRDEQAARRVTLMVDSPEHLDVVDAVAPPRQRATVRVCLELDASYDLPGLRVGVWRSPVHTPEQARSAARAIADRPGFDLVGVMAYEAQIAGLGNRPARGGVAAHGRVAVVRGLQRLSWRELT